MKLAELKKGTRRINVVVPGDENVLEEKVWVDYNPGEFTLEVSEKLLAIIRKGEEDPEAIMALKVMLDPVLVDWDLEDDEGNHMPPTEDNLKKVPLSFLGQILMELRMDVGPDPTKLENSNGTSPGTDEQDSPPSGSSLSV